MSRYPHLHNELEEHDSIVYTNELPLMKKPYPYLKFSKKNTYFEAETPLIPDKNFTENPLNDHSTEPSSLLVNKRYYYVEGAEELLDPQNATNSGTSFYKTPIMGHCTLYYYLYKMMKKFLRK